MFCKAPDQDAPSVGHPTGWTVGLIFFGMELMSISTGPIREWPPFIELMQSMRNPLLSVAIGALFTGIVQSSSATTGNVIVLASQGLISIVSIAG